MKNKILLSAMALSLIAGSAAIAQEASSARAAPPAAGERMKDGKMMRGFARIDSDGDGNLTIEEFSLDGFTAADHHQPGVESMGKDFTQTEEAS